MEAHGIKYDDVENTLKRYDKKRGGFLQYKHYPKLVVNADLRYMS